MNKLREGISSQVEPVSAGYDMQEFSSLVSQLDAAILSGKVTAPFVLGGLQAILDGSLKARDFPVWKTLTVEHKNRNWQAYQVALHEAGCMHTNGRLAPLYYSQAGEDPSHRSRGFLKHLDRRSEISDLGEDLDIDMVRVSPHDAGFIGRKMVGRGAFYKRTAELGLMQPWPEIGFALRLAYLDQPPGEWLIIASGDNHGPEATHHLIRIGCAPHGTRCIEAIVSRDWVRADEEYVFIKPRAASQ